MARFAVLCCLAGVGSALRVPVAGSKAEPQLARREALARALALVPLVGAPLMASALDGPNNKAYGGAPFAGVDAAVSSATPKTLANSAGRRAATISISGKYTDPQHPGCLRKVSKSGSFLFVTGADEDGKKFTLNGKYEEDKGLRKAIIDFSPKGGPSDVSVDVGFGPGGLGDIVLKFPDGNVWSKV